MEDSRSVADRVNEHLEADLVLHEALARGIVSLRKAARNLIAREGWDASEEAVVSALRRYSPTRARVPPVRDLLGEGRITTRSGISLYAVPWTPDTRRRLSRILAANDVPCAGVPRLIGGDNGTLVVADHEVAATVRDRLGQSIVGSSTGVTEIKLHLPNASTHAAAVLSIAFHVLSKQGVTILGVASRPPDHVLLVDPDDAIQAYGVLSELITQ